MNANPYESPQSPNTPPPVKRNVSSASFWFAVSILAWVGLLVFWQIARALPRDRIWPERLDANQSDLIHAAIAVSILCCFSTAIVSGFASLVAFLRR